METLEKDLASFARNYGRSLDSDDPHAVLEAEANLATLVNGDWIDRLSLDFAARARSRRNDIDVPWRLPRLSEETEANGSEFGPSDLVAMVFGGHGIRLIDHEEEEDDGTGSSYLRWSCGALRTPTLDARNRTAASSVTTRLSTICKIERLMETDEQDDWGFPGVCLAPVVEEVLRSCLVEAGRRAWHEGTRLQHRFFSPVLESIFEKGGKPTLIHFEAIAYLLQKQEPSQPPLPDLGPVGTRLVLTPQFQTALKSYKAVRNQLVHSEGQPWAEAKYRTHCDLLFGCQSASDWLERSFAVDSTGILGKSGRNLLSSLLVNRYLLDCVERRPDVGLTLLLTGFLQRRDLPSGWANGLLTSARSKEPGSKCGTVLALVKHALGAGVLSPGEFNSADLEGLVEFVGIDEALDLVRRNALTPSDFSSAWKRHAAEQSSWWQYQKLLACGLLSPSESDADLRREKLNLLDLDQAQVAVASGVVASEFGDEWRLKMGRQIERMKLHQALWLVENGLFAGPRPSQARVAAWSRKASKRDAALLVAAGLAEPADFRPSWGPLLSAATAETTSE